MQPSSIRESARPMTPITAQNPAYVVVTPVRDEAAHIAETLESMIAQTVRPVEWVIVDDGSTDDTREIIGRYAAQHAWIVPLHRPRTGPRQNASAVMEAFYAGYDRLQTTGWEYLVKLDGDVSFAPFYFESCLREFRADPQLGVGGGLICNAVPGVAEPEPEPCPVNHVRGATKIYPRACWESMGGLLRTPGWDTIDEVKAQMAGWKVRTFRDLTVVQHRPTGAAEGSWRNAVKDGRADYITGYHPLFMFLKCVKRLLERPYLVGSVGLAWGFLQGYMKGLPQVDDRAVIAYVRKQQLRRLLLRDSIWK